MADIVGIMRHIENFTGTYQPSGTIFLNNQSIFHTLFAPKHLELNQGVEQNTVSNYMY
jgi:hypothetical protein